MTTSAHPSYLNPELSSFDPSVRAAALARFAERHPTYSARPAPERVANMHCHSFFSYSALGLAPSALAVMAYEEAIDLLGIVDFDVIDGVDEFLDACELLGIRGGGSIESRVYLPEFAKHEVNSPGEPGVLYHMGTGFTSSHVPAEVQPLLGDIKARARQRNLALVERVNEYLAPIQVDYAAEVLPLTPSANATERHIIMAYIAAVDAQVDDPLSFWAERLQIARASVATAQETPFGLVNLIRKRLMKQGGAAYVQPGPETFPRVEEFHAFVLGCGALPCVTWLDGTSAGEQAMPELLEFLVERGAAALNIIPDRNWNIADPADKAVKLQHLYAVVELARACDLPILVGTEMNSPGQPLVDLFDAPELAPVRAAFIDGAHFLVGHTMLGRHADLGYQSAWAREHLPTRQARSDFYTRIGRRLPAGEAGVAATRALSPAQTPDAVLAAVG